MGQITGDISSQSDLNNNFLSLKEQTLSEEKQKQARDNIKAATGGNRKLAQNIEQGFHDIKEYTSAENSFICPSDGYAQIRKIDGKANLHIDNYTLVTASNGTQAIFVAQGMHIWVDGEPNAASFIEWITE